MTLDVGASTDLDLVYADCGVSATYRHGGSHSVDAAALTETASFSDEAVTAVLNKVTAREAEAAGGKIVEGDYLARVRTSELTSDPAADDELVVGSVTWQVSWWDKDAQGLEWMLGLSEKN